MGWGGGEFTPPPSSSSSFFPVSSPLSPLGIHPSSLAHVTFLRAVAESVSQMHSVRQRGWKVERSQ